MSNAHPTNPRNTISWFLFSWISAGGKPDSIACSCLRRGLYRKPENSKAPGYSLSLWYNLFPSAPSLTPTPTQWGTAADLAVLAHNSFALWKFWAFISQGNRETQQPPTQLVLSMTAAESIQIRFEWQVILGIYNPSPADSNLPRVLRVPFVCGSVTQLRHEWGKIRRFWANLKNYQGL